MGAFYETTTPGAICRRDLLGIGALLGYGCAVRAYSPAAGGTSRG